MIRTSCAGAAAALLMLTSSTAIAAGITRSCGPSAIANTADILCAPPSGPCDAASVVVSASITLTDGPCRFDLGGRALTIARTLQVRITPDHLDNTLALDAVGDLTLARGGRLKARGDFRAIEGQFTGGGFVDVHANGTVRLAGLIDVSGDSGGAIEIHAEGDVVVEPHAKIRGNGRTKFSDMGVQYTDGGYVLLSAASGSASFAGRVQMRGGNGGTGGSLDIDAGGDVEITGKIDLTGGQYGGGDSGLIAAGDLTIRSAKLDLRSRGGGADGGLVVLSSGHVFAPDGSPLEAPAGVGNLRIERTLFNVDGSANDLGTSGAGGTVWGFSYGNIDLSDVTIRASGASSPENPDGYGGDVSFGATPFPGYGDPLGYTSPFDVHVHGRIIARGGGPEGLGGVFSLYGPRHVIDEATLDLGGRQLAGEVWMVAGGDLEIRRRIDAAVDSMTGTGGLIQIAAGTEGVGRLLIADDLRAGGGLRNGVGETIDLRGCPVEVAPGVTIDGSSGFGAGGQPGTPTVAFASGRPLVLGDGSRYLAGPAGTISVSHPPMQMPIVGSGVTFDPPLLDTVVPQSAFPTCPRCGDGPGDACSPRVHIGAITVGTDPVDATVAAESPLGLPLSGTVAVCDGTGVEDVTFTWLARTCDPHDVFELLVNDTVVAEVPTDVGSCDCPQGPESYTVPIGDVAPLLTAGVNRFGIRRSAVGANEGCRVIIWAYAAVTTDGVAMRVPIFAEPLYFEPLGADAYAVTDACAIVRGCGPLEASHEAVLCNAAVSTPWSAALPCGLDVSALASDHPYTLLVSATDGVVAPAVAARDFVHATERALTLNGAPCP